MWDFVSGWAAGMVGITVGFPLDTIKVNQQTQGLGAFRCTQMIYQQAGVRGFFRGLSFPLATSGAVCSMYFGVYRTSLNGLLDFDQRFHSHSQSHSVNATSLPQTTPRHIHLYHGLAGCTTGVFHAIFLTPIELVKIQLQTTRPTLNGFIGAGAEAAAAAVPTSTLRPNGPIAVFRDIFQAQGVRGMYKGLYPTMCRSIPGGGMYMVTYESLSGAARSWAGENESGRVAGVFMAGGISGVFTWWAMMPFDTIKSILQADDTRNPRYNGMLDCARHVWKEQGPAGFGRGFWAVGFRAFPVNGAMFLTLEAFNFLFRDVLKLSHRNS